MKKDLDQLVRAYQSPESQEDAPVSEEGVIVVDALVSKAASVYEIFRNALEYAESHLLRRNAIRRILRRHWTGEEDVTNVAQTLLHELIWAGYLPNKSVPLSRHDDVRRVLEKYQVLMTAAETYQETYGELADWILDLTSTEIEALLEMSHKEEALVSFAYGRLKQKVEWADDIDLPEEERDMQLFLTTHRALLRSNPATLRYRAFLLFYPDWKSHHPDRVKEVAAHLQVVYEAVEYHVTHPKGEMLYRLLRKKIILFKLIHDLLAEDAGRGQVLTLGAGLDEEISRAAHERYKAFRSRLGRSVLRAVVFLFCTKLILAFIIELPYEAFVLAETNYTPLIVNVLFHPLLLALLGFTVTVPAKRNTRALIDGVRSVLTDGEALKMRVRNKASWSSGVRGLVFNLLYTLTFVISYGLITWLLVGLGFNIVSIFLFLLFFSLVVFFGLYLRYTKRELVIVSGQGNVLTAIADFFFLPIIRAGRWISLRAPRINIFLFFLDFIIEAPFKMAIQIIEGWLAFMREKKEEI